MTFLILKNKKPNHGIVAFSLKIEVSLARNPQIIRMQIGKTIC